MLGHAAGLSIEQMISRGPDEAPAGAVTALRALTARRIKREPMAYILGEREFWGLPFRVTPAVLVPRPDSETVIEAALALLEDRTRPWRLLDLGLGSGCLLLTLLKEFPNATGVGIDASQEALAVATANAQALGVSARATLLQDDWRIEGWEGRLGGPFDFAVSNPPYIGSDTIDGLMPEVSRYEPRLALDGGPDGLAAYRSIASKGREFVTGGGYLAVEAGEGQAAEIAEIFASAGLSPLPPWKDLGGIERVVAGRH